MTVHYDRPNTVARGFNTAIRHLAELGISVAGTPLIPMFALAG